VVEGLDRSGKSSQCQVLHDHLNKTRKVRYVKFPGRQ
jgi:thymidylate kinase